MVHFSGVKLIILLRKDTFPPSDTDLQFGQKLFVIFYFNVEMDIYLSLANLKTHFLNQQTIS